MIKVVDGSSGKRFCWYVTFALPWTAKVHDVTGADNDDRAVLAVPTIGAMVTGVDSAADLRSPSRSTRSARR